MDTKYINLKFINGNKTIEVGKGKSFRLLNIEGLDSGEILLNTTNNPIGYGSKLDNKRIPFRPIMVECEYVGKNKESKRRLMSSFFNVYSGGILQVDYMGVEREILYEVENYLAPLNNLYEPFKFLIHLYCPNPFLSNLQSIKEEVAIWRGAFEFPLEIIEEGIEMGYREPSLIVNIFNEGDVSCGMKIQFKALATVTNPSLFNANTREYFKINKVMEAGDVITVTTHFQNKKVELNRNGVKSNAFNWIDLQSTFLQLDVGDNLLRYDADEGLDNLEVSIYYNPQYLGV